MRLSGIISEEIVPEFKVEEIVRITNGEAFNLRGTEIYSEFEFDTRNIKDDKTLFFALNSENGDGHKFVPNLKKFKGSAAVVNSDFDRSKTDIPLIVVKDPLKAAHRLASEVRKRYKRIKYIGVTGSAGKTTTKEFISQILSSKYKVFRSIKNWNNWIGLPFSMLKLKGDEDFAVFELAMSYPGIGEIDLLADILKPDIAVILNVFPVHMEFLKTLKNIARGKAEILNYMNADSVAFITGDSEFIKDEVRIKKGRKVFFGMMDGGNEIVLRGIERSEIGSSFFIDFYGIEVGFQTNLTNIVQIENLFAAIIVSQHSGMKCFEISSAIKNIETILGRGGVEKFGELTLIDETYNSNPVALSKTLEWVDKEFEEPKIAVLGDMLELGDDEEKYHQEAGIELSKLNYAMLITVGERSELIAKGAEEGGFSTKNIKSFKTSAEAGEYIVNNVNKNSILLFKASRGIKLEKAIAKIKNG